MPEHSHSSVPPEAFVPVAFVRLLFEYLEKQGLDAAAVLNEAPPKDQMAPLDSYPARQYCQLLERASETLQDPMLGLHLGQTIKPAHLGALGYVLASCATVSAALQRMMRYQHLLHDTNLMQVHVDGDEVVLEWHATQGRYGPLFDEMTFAAIVQFMRNLGDKNMPVKRVDFINPRPGSVAPYEKFFGGEVRYEQTASRIHVPLYYLGLPLSKPDPALVGLLEHQVEALLDKSPRVDELERGVRRIVASLAHQGVPSLERVARELRLSPRQLTRRLHEQGLNFRNLREDTLRQVAEKHMADPGLTLTEVALLLGYSEQSAFTRAFTRWTGQSPREWRKQRACHEASADR